MQMSGQFLVTVALLPWKEFLVLLEQDDVWAPGQVWTFWKRKNFLSLLVMKPQIIQPIALSLYHLLTLSQLPCFVKWFHIKHSCPC